ncbi:Unknown protein, partial [Striga hermonthica]
VYLETAHFLCAYHISNNLRTHFKKEPNAVKNAFNAAARVYTVDDYNHHMAEINKLDPRVPPFLEKIGIQKWERIHCPSNRYFTMTSNAAEAINSATREIRDLPITTLLEPLRSLQEKWNVSNRDEAASTFTTLAKKAHKTLENNYKVAASFS